MNDDDLYPESEIGRLEGTVEALEGLLAEQKAQTDRLRQGIISVLAPVFVTEVNGEVLAATMSDGMILAALVDQVRRQDEGASLLADVAANLEARAEKAEAENARLRALGLDELTREGQALDLDGSAPSRPDPLPTRPNTPKVSERGHPAPIAAATVRADGPRQEAGGSRQGADRPPVPDVEVPPESSPDEDRSGGAIDPDEGTKRYRAARANVLQDPRAEAVHAEVTREIESHVAQRAVDPDDQWGDYMRGEGGDLFTMESWDALMAQNERLAEDRRKRNAEIDRLRAAVSWLLTEMPVGWEDIAGGEGRHDVVAVARSVTEELDISEPMGRPLTDEELDRAALTAAQLRTETWQNAAGPDENDPANWAFEWPSRERPTEGDRAAASERVRQNKAQDERDAAAVDDIARRALDRSRPYCADCGNGVEVCDCPDGPLDDEFVDDDDGFEGGIDE